MKKNKLPLSHLICGIVFVFYGVIFEVVAFSIVRFNGSDNPWAPAVFGLILVILGILFLIGKMEKLKHFSRDKTHVSKDFDDNQKSSEYKYYNCYEYYDYYKDCNFTNSDDDDIGDDNDYDNASDYNEEDIFLSIDGMDGHEFEYYCANILKRNGFTNVSVTQGSGDQGVDILATKEDVKYAIQCKNYATPLGNKPIQEVTAGKMFYNCHVGVVLTNSTFTHNAQELAKATGVLLWDREILREMIEPVNEDEK